MSDLYSVEHEYHQSCEKSRRSPLLTLSGPRKEGRGLSMKAMTPAWHSWLMVSVAVLELLLVPSCGALWAVMEYGADLVSASNGHVWEVSGGGRVR